MPLINPRPPELDSTLFTWQMWRGGSPHTLGLECRYGDAWTPSGQARIRDATVEWCDATRVVCRPKENHVAVMCWWHDTEFWFHLRRDEFDALWA